MIFRKKNEMPICQSCERVVFFTWPRNENEHKGNEEEKDKNVFQKSRNREINKYYENHHEMVGNSKFDLWLFFFETKQKLFPGDFFCFVSLMGNSSLWLKLFHSDSSFRAMMNFISFRRIFVEFYFAVEKWKLMCNFNAE